MIALSLNLHDSRSEKAHASLPLAAGGVELHFLRCYHGSRECVLTPTLLPASGAIAATQGLPGICRHDSFHNMRMATLDRLDLSQQLL
jgi:hypothetical protein